MLSLQQIQRMMNQRQFRQLIGRILANGRCDDRRITQRLLQPHNVIPAGLALALQRVVELTYRPTAVAEALACRLLDQQRGDGLFGPVDQPRQDAPSALHCEKSAFEEPGGEELGVTALAVRALAAFLRQQQLAGERVSRRIEPALERALAALTLRQALQRQLGCDSIDRDIVAWQLVDDPMTAAAISAISDSTAVDEGHARRTRAA
jgi:hypothetical protein